MYRKMAENKRLILPGFLACDLCKELEFIHKSCSSVGYRPHVFSTTLAHLIATNCGYLIMPFIPVRERLKEKVEEYFGCEYELCIEFTGLISWTKGAKIGWHSDDNRPYLKQRHYAAVCYLNNQDEDFKGGLFHFQQGEPPTVVPRMGDAILYTADDRNVHCVDEITDGERCTLTMWFTRDSSHNEDVKLINQLSDRLYLFYNNTDVGDYHSCSLVHRGKEIVSLDSNSKTGEDKFISEDVGNLNFSGYLPFSSDSIPLDWLPLPASSNMYWVNPETPIEEEAYDHFFDPEESASQNDSGFDIRWARISRLGFELCFDKSQNKLNEFETSMQTTNYYGTLNATDVLDGPLRLKWKGVELPVLFVNSLQVVQVVEFFQWKFLKESSHCAEKDYGHGSTVTTLREGSAGHQESQAEDENPSKKLLSKECNMANSENATFNLSHSVFSYEKQFQFSCEDFVHATRNWECYVCTLWRALLISLPQWKANEIIFPVSA